MPLDVVVGLQRGDEGKGRFVDMIANNYTIIARANGGSNAGHTVVPDTMEALALHQVPSGITHPGRLNIIGGGVYVDPRRLHKEIDEVKAAGYQVSPTNLLISQASHLVFPHHIGFDALREGSVKAQGSTKSGIAFVAADKYLREGVRLETVALPEVLLARAREGLEELNKHLPESARQSKDQIEQVSKEWVEAVQALQPYMAETVEIINDKLAAGEKV
jgi:adenylosuccinate synthase